MEKTDLTVRPTLIIGGGVGPMAGVELHRKIIEHTLTDGTDQDHFDVIHLSLASRISDRTLFLLESDGVNPGDEMADVVEIALRGLGKGEGGSAPGKQCIVGVPCNTFHAPPIFDRFLSRMDFFPGKEDGRSINNRDSGGPTISGPTVKVVHMLQETLDLIRQLQPDAGTVGLMSTTGTRRSRVWHELLESAGYDIVEVEESVQPELHETIYHPEWGLKAVSPASETACGRFANYADALISDGADVLVLGCTEIPLALPGLRFRNTPLVDPVLALARGMIREGDADKLRPLPQSGSDQPS